MNKWLRLYKRLLG